MNDEERQRLLSPIVVGIVGHTRLRPEDTDTLTLTVRRILEGLRARYPSTPLIVLSSLAEGADQLCADVALALGLEVIAPLPFPPELYRTRFKAEAARHNLSRLVRQPGVSVCYPPGADAVPLDFPAVLADAARRKQRYADLGLFIARHSHALIALWDGDEAPDASLTAQLIAFKALGAWPASQGYCGAPPEPGIVFSVFAPRTGEKLKPGTPGTCEILPRPGPASEAGEELFARTCSLTDALNARLRSAAPPRSLDLAGGGGASGRLGDLAAFRDLVARESRRCKRHVSHAYIAVFVLVLCGAALLHVYGHHTEILAATERYHRTLFVAACACFGLAALFPLIFRTRLSENCSLDYRALAEALRVQFYWSHAGLCEWVPDHYLRRQRSELAWIREATRAWALRLQVAGAVDGAQAAGSVATAWFDAQRQFHEREFRNNDRARARWNFISKAGLGAAGCVAVLLLAGGALEAWAAPGSIWRERMVETAGFSLVTPAHAWLMTLGLTLLCGALALAYAEKRLFAEHARHFRAMGSVYRDAAAQAAAHAAAGRRHDLRRLLQQIGTESLDENAEWLILHRVRHFEVPTAG